MQILNRLHRVLAEPIAGGANKDLASLQAKALLASVHRRDIARKTRRRMAADQITDLAAVDVNLKVVPKELRDAVQARSSELMDVYGVGPAGAGPTSTRRTAPLDTFQPWGVYPRPSDPPRPWLPPRMPAGVGAPGVSMWSAALDERH